MFMLFVTMLTCMVLSSDWFARIILGEQLDGNAHSSFGDYLFRQFAANWLSYFGVYRICIVMATFHLVLLLLTIRTPNSECMRGRIHHG
jgi:hypothetical protein